MDWERHWLEAWSKQRTEVLMAARKKAGKNAHIRRSTLTVSDVDTHACRTFRLEHCPKPLEFRYDIVGGTQQCFVCSCYSSC